MKYFSFFLIIITAVTLVDAFFIHIRSPDRMFPKQRRTPPRKWTKANITRRSVPTFYNSHYNNNTDDDKPENRKANNFVTGSTIWPKPPVISRKEKAKKGWSVLIASDCPSVVLNGKTVIADYRGPEFYVHHSAEKELYADLYPRGGSTPKPHAEVSQSKFNQELKALHCTGRFANRCSRLDVSGEAFSVVIMGFTLDDAGIYRCINEDGQVIKMYHVSVKENILPVQTMNQPALFIDIRPYTEQSSIEQNVAGIIVASILGGLFFILTVVISVIFFVEDPKSDEGDANPQIAVTTTVPSQATTTFILPNQNQVQVDNSSSNLIFRSPTRHHSASADNTPRHSSEEHIPLSRVNSDQPPRIQSQTRSGHASMTGSLSKTVGLMPPMQTRSISQELRMFRLAVHLTNQQKKEIERTQLNSPELEQETAFTSAKSARKML